MLKMHHLRTRHAQGISSCIASDNALRPEHRVRVAELQDVRPAALLRRLGLAGRAVRPPTGSGPTTVATRPESPALAAGVALKAVQARLGSSSTQTAPHAHQTVMPEMHPAKA
jgi:hypothetical protein